MTQENKPTPSVTLDFLRIRSAELAKGIAGLRSNIQAAEQQLATYRNDLLSTAGAKQFVDQLLAQEDKKIADAASAESTKAE